MEEARVARTQILDLEVQLKVETDKSAELRQQLLQHQRAFADAVAQANQEATRAAAAVVKAEALENEAARLRREGAVLRQLAEQLAGASGAINRSRVSDNTVSLQDLTEGNASDFQITAADGAFCMVNNDSEHRWVNRSSLRVDTLSESEFTIRRRTTPHATYDLSSYSQFRGVVRFQKSTSSRLTKAILQLGRGHDFVEYLVEMERDSNDGGDSICLHCSLQNPWRFAGSNPPTLANVEWIALVGKCADIGLSCWIDGLGFFPESESEEPSDTLEPVV